MADDTVADSVKVASRVDVKEGTGVEHGLLEVKVDLLAVALGGRVEVGKNLSLQSVGEGVVKLKLGAENVGGGPSLGKAHSCVGFDQSTLYSE